jgi:hypothetical protein
MTFLIEDVLLTTSSIQAAQTARACSDKDWLRASLVAAGLHLLGKGKAPGLFNPEIVHSPCTPRPGSTKASFHSGLYCSSCYHYTVRHRQGLLVNGFFWTCSCYSSLHGAQQDRRGSPRIIIYVLLLVILKFERRYRQQGNSVLSLEKVATEKVVRFQIPHQNSTNWKHKQRAVSSIYATLAVRTADSWIESTERSVLNTV